MEHPFIRIATVHDAPSIAEIHVKTWQDAYVGLIPDSYLQSLSVSERSEEWKKGLSKPEPNSATFVYEQDRKILGWCSVGTNRDDDTHEKLGKLWAVYVSPDSQKRGVGTWLMNRGLSFLRERGYTKATLWVLNTNDKAWKFYESKSWKADGKTKVEPREGFELHEVRYVIDL